MKTKADLLAEIGRLEEERATRYDKWRLETEAEIWKARANAMRDAFQIVVSRPASNSDQ